MRVVIGIVVVALLSSCATVKRWQEEAEFVSAIEHCLKISDHERKVRCIKAQVEDE